MIEGRDASTASHSEAAFLRAILAGYPDRIARRRQAGSPRFLLASGHGAVLGRDSGVRNAEFVVAVDVTAGRRGEGAEATIRIASEIDPAWLADVPAGSGLRATRVDHETDASGRVRATARDMYGAIVLSERPAAVDPDVAARLLAAAYRARPPSERDAQLLRRLRFAGLPVDLDALLSAATAGRRALDDVDIHAALSWDVSRDLDRLAPASLPVPSGRTTRLRYEDGRHRRRLGEAAGAVRAGGISAARTGPRARRSSSSSRPMGVPCRRPATCGASGTRHTRRSARSCADATRGIRGRRIRGRRLRLTVRSRGESEAASTPQLHNSTMPKGSRLRAQGSGLTAQGSRLKAQGSGLRAQGSGLTL